MGEHSSKKVKAYYTLGLKMVPNNFSLTKIVTHEFGFIKVLNPPCKKNHKLKHWNILGGLASRVVI